MANGAMDVKSSMGRSWQHSLKSDTREGAEKRLKELDYSWEWLEDGRLRVTSPALPGVRKLQDGRISFFNQFVAAWKGWSKVKSDPKKRAPMTFGDGTPIDSSTADRVCDICYSEAFNTPWQNGDVVVIDNFVAMHGRIPYEGTRKVLASLAAQADKNNDGY